MMVRFTIRAAILCVGLGVTLFALASEPGSTVIVIYNTRVPESKQVAEYYAEKRQVPPGQLFGLALPESESMSRKEYIEQLQDPLMKSLETKRIFRLALPPSSTNSVAGANPGRRVVQSSIRYA